MPVRETALVARICTVPAAIHKGCTRMSEQPATAPPGREPWWRRVWARVQQLRKPLLVLAGTGAVLGGLAGYWNAYRAVKDVSGAAAAPAVAEPAARTVAVLAFSDLGDATADASFAEGVGEELVHLLARVPGLRVVARRSALQFKGQSLAMTEMASRLQVAYLVDGSVRRTADQVRIGAQLVDGRNGAVLWSGQFERDMKNAMAAQGDLALQIARSLKLPLDASTLAGSGTQNVKAWQLFMQAQRLPGGQREPLYRQALALDPTFARAHVELAEEELQARWRGGRDAATAARRWSSIPATRPGITGPPSWRSRNCASTRRWPSDAPWSILSRCTACPACTWANCCG